MCKRRCLQLMYILSEVNHFVVGWFSLVLLLQVDLEMNLDLHF